MVRVVSITKKGRATISKDLRDEFGSLKDLFNGKTSRKVLEEARAEDLTKEKRLLERLGK